MHAFSGSICIWCSLIAPAGPPETLNPASCLLSPPSFTLPSHLQISENKNMWGMLTAETFTPFIELDFIGADVHVLLGKTAVRSQQRTCTPLTPCRV